MAAVLLLTGNDKKHTAGPQRPAVAALSCTGIKDAMIHSGAFKAGEITVSNGGTPPSTGVPRPAGAPTTTCTVRPTDPSDAQDVDHVTAIAWRGVTERAFAVVLKNAGYHANSEGDYTFYSRSTSSAPALVTATVADQLVTFYVA